MLKQTGQNHAYLKIEKQFSYHYYPQQCDGRVDSAVPSFGAFDTFPTADPHVENATSGKGIAQTAK